METKAKRIKLEDVAPDIVLEEVELEESIRSVLMSTLPILKSKVKLYTNLKEERLKEKVEKLEKELNKKDSKLRQIEAESSAQFGQLSQKDVELGMLISLNSKVSKDLDLAKKAGMDDKIQINAIEEKIENEENQHAEEKNEALKGNLRSSEFIVISTNKTEKYDASHIIALKEKEDNLNSAEKDKTLKYRNQLNSRGGMDGMG